MAIGVTVNSDELGGALDERLERLLEAAVVATAGDRQLDDADISLTLLGDDAIADMNRRYLGHDGPTDVISFALYEEGEVPVGDVYVGYEQALRQAGENGVALEEELVRLAVHGTLHVLGEDHPEGEERVDSPMWLLQERIVARLLG